MSKCVFCDEVEREIIAENELALAFWDQFPVNEGHALVIPRRHVESYFEATLEEISCINRLIFQVKDILDENYSPHGYNIGVNVGRAAGQTIFHLHVHVIPRYEGDVEDPRGGVRNIKKSIIPYYGKEGE